MPTGFHTTLFLDSRIWLVSWYRKLQFQTITARNASKQRYSNQHHQIVSEHRIGRKEIVVSNCKYNYFVHSVDRKKCFVDNFSRKKDAKNLPFLSHFFSKLIKQKYIKLGIRLLLASKIQQKIFEFSWEKYEQRRPEITTLLTIIVVLLLQQIIEKLHFKRNRKQRLSDFIRVNCL